MRTLLPLLLIALLGYAGWFYWREYTAERPLREALLLTPAEDVREIEVTRGKYGFRLLPTGEGNGWMVKRGTTELYDQSDRIRRLIRQLTALRTDSVMRRFPESNLVSVRLNDGERIDLHFPTEGTTRARVTATGDVFALNPEGVSGLQNLLRFDTYRGDRLLRLAAETVDSIWAMHHDSLLWRATAAAATRLSPTFIAPATAPYADYFDEIIDREKYHATVTLFAAGQGHRVEVFRDSLWPKPYVLVGEDFPRRYFAIDSLGATREN